MPVRVDYGAAWAALADELADRQGIGRDGLYALMKRLEVEHSFEEGVVERNLRLYGVLFAEDLRVAARDDEVNQSGNDPAGVGEAAPLAATDTGPEHPENREVHDDGVHDGARRAGQRDGGPRVPAVSGR